MSNFEWVAVAVVSALAAARITRLVVWDTYPPAVWFRMKWDNQFGIRGEDGRLLRDEDGDAVGPWVPLVHCGYCFGVYASALVILPGWLSGWHTAWWLVCGWLAVSYLAAIVMAYDGED